MSTSARAAGKLRVAFAAVESRDPRFDGWFHVSVATTTGLYCRPNCPAVMPSPRTSGCSPRRSRHR
ncbi:Ada metal-binding domain-containing protein [Nonomuraea sp. GTA35]|uniref:Ada metal-binding domain-containing protein n=1 Tax=Nonomuraea sp. GTA35 TaxID=1676746 RepID=UPI0035C192F2